MKKLIQRNISLLQQIPVVTRYITILCLIVFPIQLLWFDFNNYIALHSIYDTAFFIWQPLTCTFAHVDPFHLMYNTLYFILFGYFVEKQIGTTWYLLLVLSSILGSFICVQYNWIIGNPIIGLSSVVYGVNVFVLFVKTRNNVILAIIKLLGFVFLLSQLKDCNININTTDASHIGGCIGAVLFSIIYFCYRAVKKG